ncbi:hypothetical protein LCGC14_1111290 [marine sediment metagenome]|uniref:Uncharacterized protein n=1 Tax=marine sediment metagenome TaxID=412755 RepID=A0A0F9QCQ8_9ZZZZ
MANPVMAAITTFDIKRDSSSGGCLREFWIRIPGLSGASAATSTDQPLYYLLNPINADLVVLNALAVITTASGGVVQLNVGLADDAAGTNVGAEIFDTITDSAAGVLEGTTPQAIAGTGSKAIWKKSGTATDSYLTVVQGADADGSAMRWGLFLKVIPYDDMIGREGEQAAVTVA